MKHLLVAIIAFTFAASAVQAQTSANAQAGSQSGAAALSSSGVVFNQPGKTSSTITTRQDGYSEIRNVPSVTAPAVFGGGHPCLAGKSGGVAVAGFGGSYGAGKADPACMAWVMGNPEIALRIMMNTDPHFCRAVNNVGYYRIGNRVVPAKCGKTVVKGGVDTPGVTSKVTKVSTRSAGASAPVLYSKCALEGNQIKIKYTSAGRKDKPAAAAACQRALGY